MLEQWLAELTAWWHTVPPEFALLLALPFVVGVVGLWADWRQRRKPHAPVR
jgi:hypothetical protein